jgi:hypothetical protein
MRRKVTSLVAGLLFAVTGFVAVVPSASAASGDKGLVYAFTKIHDGPYSWRTYRITQHDAYLPFHCWTDTRDSPSAPVRRWFQISGNVGWIRASFVYQQPSLPHC